MIKIYFPHHTVTITNDTIEDLKDTNSLMISDWNADGLSIFEKIEGTKETQLIILQTDINAVLEDFKKQFLVLQAAGGIVMVPDSEILLIFRRGKWDLPKGKLDEGESIESCAVREVEEETGLRGISLGKHLLTTYHTYQERGENILKETYWYQMSLDKKQDLIPQVEEDIQECRWVRVTDLTAFENNMQPSVKDVLNTIKAVQ